MSSRRVVIVLALLALLATGVAAYSVGVGDVLPLVGLGPKTSDAAATDQTSGGGNRSNGPIEADAPDSADGTKSSEKSRRRAATETGTDASQPADESPLAVEASKRKLQEELERKLRDVKPAKPEAAPTAVKPPAKPPVDSRNAVVAGKGDQKPNPRLTFTNLMGDPKGLNQTRQGAGRPSRTLRAPEKGTVPASDAKTYFGLLGEYFRLTEDPRKSLTAGRDPLKSAPVTDPNTGAVSAAVPLTADQTRIDANINFPNRKAFKLDFDGDNIACRWRGLLKASKDQTFIFGLGTDMGGALVIDGQVVLLNDTFQWYVENFAAVTLSEGYHTIMIEHFEGPQGGDEARNMACVLSWKRDWSSASRPFPGEFLYVPADLRPPVITKVSPDRCEVGAQVTISGENFEPQRTLAVTTTPGADGAAPVATLSGGDETLTVRFDGIDAKIVSSSRNGIVAEVPPGAGTGPITVYRGATPSLAWKRFTVATQFGLIVSVWDLTGYAKIVPKSGDRPPDYITLDDNPFPLTADKFPQFAGKDIGVRVEGMIASVPEEIVTLPPGAMNPRFDDWCCYVVSSAALTGTVTAGSVSLALGPPDNPKQQQTSNILSWYQATHGWLPFSVETVVNTAASPAPSLTCELAREGVKFSRPGLFKPASPVPSAPLLHTPDPRNPPSGSVGGEVLIYIDAESAKRADLQWLVDNIPATARPRNSSDPKDPAEMAVGHTMFLARYVTIPDGCGDGELRVRAGIVPSDILKIDVANRGLTGFFYDFDSVLKTIPAMDALSPQMRRVDKHLIFQNGTDFKLPFPAERFSAEWFGSIRAEQGGEYTFIVQSDDGARFTVDGQVVVEYNKLRPPGESTGKIMLAPGWHTLHVEFFENDILENLVVWWVPPGKTAREDIPTKHLSTDYPPGIPFKQVQPGVAVK